MYKEFNPFFSPKMNDLPPEITKSIASFLDDDSIRNLSESSRRYRDITSESRVQRREKRRQKQEQFIAKFRRKLPAGTPMTFTRPFYPNWPSTDEARIDKITGVVLDDIYFPDGYHATLLEGDDGIDYKLSFRIRDDGTTEDPRFNGDVIIN